MSLDFGGQTSTKHQFWDGLGFATGDICECVLLNELSFGGGGIPSLKRKSWEPEKMSCQKERIILYLDVPGRLRC